MPKEKKLRKKKKVTKNNNNKKENSSKAEWDAVSADICSKQTHKKGIMPGLGDTRYG